MPAVDEPTAVQSNLDRLAGTVESLDPRVRKALAKFLRASPRAQVAAMATSPETSAILPLLLSHLNAHPDFRPLLLSLFEGG